MAMIRRLLPLLALVLLISLALLHFPYNLMHNGLLPLQIGAALAADAVDLAAVALTVLLAGALGTRLRPPLSPLGEEARGPARALTALSLLSVLGRAAGLLGLFPPRWLGWLLLLGALALLNRAARDWARSALAAVRTALTTPLDPFARWLRRGVILLLVLALVLALAPPTKWDALMYHLAGGQYYLQQGRIVPAPDNYRLGYPQLVTMLYTWLMNLARPSAAAVLHWAFGALMLLTMLGVSRRFDDPGDAAAPGAAGWLAAAVLLTGETLWLEFGWPYADIAAAAYGFAAVAMLLAWGRGEPPRSGRLLVLAGVFTGSMMGTRYTAYGAALGVGLLALWLARREGALRAVRAVALVAAAAVVAFSPWLLKNLLVDGNPLSPYVWGSPAYDALDELYEGQRLARGLDPISLLVLPIQASAFGVESQDPFQAAIGPLLFGLVPFAFLGWRQRSAAERRLITALAVFSLPPYLAWAIGSVLTVALAFPRFVFPMFPALALIGAQGLLGLPRLATSIDVGRMTKVVTGVAFGTAVLSGLLLFGQAGAARVVLGLERDDEYLTRQLQAHYTAMQQIHALPGEAHVLMLWEPRGFYCSPRCVPDDALNAWWRGLQVENDPRALAAGWQGQGFTHVLIFEAGGRFLVEEQQGDPITGADWAALEEMRASGSLAPAWTMPGAYSLYEIAG